MPHNQHIRGVLCDTIVAVVEILVNPENKFVDADTLVHVWFKVIGINEYGDGMMSQIVEARTKGDN